MWAAICELYERYPRALVHLRDGWWEDRSHVEILCALATWRATIDVHGTNLHEELIFQGELAEYGRVLRQEGGGVGNAWTPGPLPGAWALGADATAGRLANP